MDNIKTIVNNVTKVFVALLALAIGASLLVGPSNMAFLGNVVGKATPAAALALVIFLGLLHLMRSAPKAEKKK